MITLPPLHIEGLLVASPFVELEGKSIIQSSSGYISVIDYSGRGYFSGKKIHSKLEFSKINQVQVIKIVHYIPYLVNGLVNLQFIKVHQLLQKIVQNFMMLRQKEPEHLLVKPIEEQKDLESRKAWKSVADAIREGNFDLIHKENQH